MKAKAKKFALVCLIAFAAALTIHSFAPAPQETAPETTKAIAILP